MIDSGRVQPAGDPINVPEPPAPAIVTGRDTGGAEETVVQGEGAGAQEALRLYGDGRAYDRDVLTAEVGHHLGQGVLAMLEAGKRLIVLKEHEGHGAWLPLLERIGISHAAAKRMMAAARKFLDGPNSSLVSHLRSVTQVYELAMLDDDDLEELREGGTIAGHDLDDIARMSPSELRAKLRAERTERREREEAQRERLATKDRRIGEMEDHAAQQSGTIRRLRTPDGEHWSDAERALHVDVAVLDRTASTLVTNLRAAIRKAREIETEQADDEAPDYMAVSTVTLWRRLQEIVSVLGSELIDIEHLVSVPLPSEDSSAE